MTDSHAILLRVDALRTSFRRDSDRFVAVDNISLTLARGRSLAIVGESGSGKSTLAHSIARLLPPGGRIDSGAIELNGRDLGARSDRDMQRLRGGAIGICLQDAALNPVLTCGNQLIETIRRHRSLSTRQAGEEAMKLLIDVGLTDAARWIDTYPHQLSGGMGRRVLLAMALAGEPQLLIADEPTAGLDAAAGQQIVSLLADLRRQRDLTVLLITHDLALAARAADEIAVMVNGSLIERAGSTELLTNPLHPYTRGLLACVPDPANPRQRLLTIPPEGSGQQAQPPVLREVTPGHWCTPEGGPC